MIRKSKANIPKLITRRKCCVCMYWNANSCKCTRQAGNLKGHTFCFRASVWALDKLDPGIEWRI